MTARYSRRRLHRRSFIGGSLGGAGVIAALPRGGVFAAGSDAIRIGLVGCGGRGTGAAAQAASAAEGVFVTALGDLFPDHVESAVAVLDARLGDRFACPASARFSGPHAADAVMAAPLDAVVLATPPHLRPRHVAAAVQAGLHVYCETPAGIDAAGVDAVRRAAAAAARRGLSFVAGLQSRHDVAVRASVDSIRAGSIGTPLRGVATFSGGLPWRRAADPRWTRHEETIRNWIEHEQFTGGPLVAHHVHAIDRMLWAFGDATPVMAVPLPDDQQLPAPLAGWTAAAVRYAFADGRSFEARIDRREGIETRIDERVVGTAGEVDLRRHTDSTPHPHATCAASLVAAIRRGIAVDESAVLGRATLAALMGDLAVRSGLPVRWSDLGIAVGPSPATTVTI